MINDTLKKALHHDFVKLEKLMNKETKNILRTLPKSNLYERHFGLGLWLRNNLLSNTKLFDCFVDNGTLEKDEMSSVFINLFQDYLNGNFLLA